MSINLTITAESSEEFRNLFSGFSSLISGGAATGIPAGASAPEKATRTRRPAESTSTDVPDKEPVDVDTGHVTLEQLRAKATEKSQAGKQPEVKALLVKFEAKSISAIPEEQFGAFFKALEAL